MKRPNRFWLTSICAMACLLGAAHWFHTRPAYAQQNTGYYDDGTFYITAYVDVDNSYNLYVESYMEVEFDYYEDIDEIEVDGYADEDGGYIGGDYSDGDDYDPAGFSLESDAPVATGHEYGMESDGWACIDDGDGDDDGDGYCDWYEVGSAYASVNVASPAPQIASLSTYSVNQGDQGTLTISGSNFIETSGDQLTLNFSGISNPFTLASAPSTCTSACTATFSYDFSGYPTGSYQLSVSNNEGQSVNSEPFTVNSSQNTGPPPDPCAVTTSPQVGFTSIVPTGTVGGSGTMAVSFSGTAFAAISPTVTYGPYSTPSSIAANIAALIAKNYYRYGLGARAFGPIIVYSGNATLGTVSNVVTGPSFTTDGSPTAGTEAQNACTNAPPPPQSMYAVAYSAYIPVDHVYGPPIVESCTYQPPLGAPGIVVSPLIYRGDAYHNTYRVTQAVSLNFAASQASGYFNDTGTTENYGFGSPYNGSTLSSQDDDAVYADYRTSPSTGMSDCYLRNAIGKASTTGWLLSPTVNSGAAIVGMAGSGQNPLSVPFGSIDWSMTTYINAASSTGHVAYEHTCYPAHQVKVANTTLYLYTPPSSDTSYIAACLTGLRPEVIGSSPTLPIH
ncbi:MAG: hypothetical protein ABR905_19280 [Terracidiphilus sp.]